MGIPPGARRAGPLGLPGQCGDYPPDPPRPGTCVQRPGAAAAARNVSVREMYAGGLSSASRLVSAAAMSGAQGWAG